jgi:hypothetical protein
MEDAWNKIDSLIGHSLQQKTSSQKTTARKTKIKTITALAAEQKKNKTRRY